MSSDSYGNEFWVNCQIEKQEADQLLKERRYKDALERYKQSSDCFENLIHYTQPPRSKQSLHIINHYIQEIQNKLKSVERILVSTNKRTIKNEYPLEELKKFVETDWLNLSLFDFIRISNAYKIPLSEDENNIENMKYKFFIDFTEKYNKFSLDLKSYDRKELEKLNLVAWNAFTIIELRNIANFFSIPFQKSGNKDELVDILYEYFQNSKSVQVVSDILFDCIQQKEQGDLFLKRFQYSEALRNYQNAQVCIDDFIRFSKSKGTHDKEMIETYKALLIELDNKIKVVERIQSKTKQTNANKLDNFENLVRIMIKEENYDDLLNFINISPNINQMIESVLLNPKIKQEGKMIKIETTRLKQLAKNSSNKLTKIIKNCNNIMIIYLYFMSTNIGSLEEFQNVLENNIYKIMTRLLEANEFKLYKNNYYRIFTKRNPEMLKNLTKEININLRDYILEFVSKIPEFDCIKDKIQKEFMMLNTNRFQIL
jgi:hypothetical protein